MEPTFLGYGDCCSHGYCYGQWRGKFSHSPSFHISFGTFQHQCGENGYHFMHESFYDLMQGEPPDWQDFVGIIALLLINSTISFIEENNAGNAAAALMAGLAPKTKVPRVIKIVITSSSE